MRLTDFYYFMPEALNEKDDANNRELAIIPTWIVDQSTLPVSKGIKNHGTLTQVSHTDKARHRKDSRNHPAWSVLIRR